MPRVGLSVSSWDASVDAFLLSADLYTVYDHGVGLKPCDFELELNNCNEKELVEREAASFPGAMA